MHFVSQIMIRNLVSAKLAVFMIILMKMLTSSSTKWDWDLTAVKNITCSFKNNLNKLIITVKRELSVTLMSMKSAIRLNVYCITVTVAEIMTLNDVLKYLNFNITDLLSTMSKQFLTLNSVYYCQHTSINV